MLNVAIIEDEIKTQNLLKSYFADFTEKSGEEFHIVCFDNPIKFLTNYKANYDVVLMDIELPHMKNKPARKASTAKVKPAEKRGPTAKQQIDELKAQIAELRAMIEK